MNSGASQRTIGNQGNPPEGGLVKYRRPLLVAAVLLSTLLYFPLNHAFANQHVLTTSLDDRLPVVPVFAVPYLLFLPAFWLTVLYSLITDRGFTQLALGIALAYFISDALYLVFHTYMPRPDHVSGAFSGLVHFVYSHDHPYNDFPSEHASSSVLMAAFYWRYWSRWRWPMLVFALLVITATVLIRQHSLAGAVSGTVLGLIAWWVAGALGGRLFGFQAGVEQNGLHSHRKDNSGE
jgi:membrane-associated phospholipid phosphatase